MPTRHFLNSQEPLSQQVVAALPESFGEGSLLIAPTAGAGRRMGELAGFSEAQTRQVTQPMQALLPTDDKIASPIERTLAWATALREAPAGHLKALFWKQSPETTAEHLKAGRNFNRLCDRLAEAALSPATFQIPPEANGSFDEARWAAIAALYADYLHCLKSWQLEDPNALRLQQIEQPSQNIRRLFIACVSDLPRAFEKYAEQLETNGCDIDVLIWNPRNIDSSHFDAWGRPVSDYWNSHSIAIEESQIHVAAAAQDEARVVAQTATTQTSGLVVVDSQLNTTIASELRAQGCQPYLPEGTPLIRCEAAKIALEWANFCQSQDLRSLRRLLELPAFCRSLDTENPLSQTDALIAIDHLLGQTIASNLDAAWAASPPLPEDAPSRDRAIRSKVRRLLGLIRTQLEPSPLDLLERAFPEKENALSPSTQRVIEIGRELEASPALDNWSEKGHSRLPLQILTQAIRGESIQAPSEANQVTLNGWLEAPWLPEPNLIFSGLVEGRLPQSPDGDPFLPDSICPALGLSHNAQRLARDTYLLDALLASRPTQEVHLSFSKYKQDGDPNRPSRLLFSTAMEDLPQRVRFLTEPASTTQVRVRRETTWHWNLPDELPKVEKISPTQFEAYLTCPFRFCLEKVLRLDSGPQAAREMDSAVFGNLIHYTLENFGRAIIPTGKQMLRLDEQSIRQQVQALLKEEALKQFGPKPAPAVQVQIANAEARLNAFARVQAECFAEGWVILDVERKLDPNSDQPLTIGSLKLSGIIDRIEQHRDTGQLRVMDYKTFSTLRKPIDTHFAPPSHNWLLEAQAEIERRGKPVAKTWKNLQLPLYRKILEHWYPQECETHTPQTAYFVLPSDPNESGICPFDELSQDLYTSALGCAAAVAEKITDGHFWPPQPFRSSWDDPLAPLLVNGAPEDCIAPETIEKLNGGGK